MFRNPDNSTKEKEVREAEEKEAQARHFAGMLWMVDGVPPPDFVILLDPAAFEPPDSSEVYVQRPEEPLKEVRVLGPRRSTAEEARKDGCELKRVAFKCVEKKFNLQEVWRKCYQLENKQWSVQELTGDDILEASERLLPEVHAAQRTKKDNFETTAEWFQANNKRRDYAENFAPVGPSWALAQLQTPVPIFPGVWYMHERQNQEGRHVQGLALPPMPFADKPAALFLLVDGVRNASAAEWCAKRFHTHLLPRLSAVHSDLDDAELVSIIKEALAHLDHALLESPARYAGCSLAVALLLGPRLAVCSLGGCRAVVCTPPAAPAEPPTKKGPGAGAAWACRTVEGSVPGHTRLDILQSQRRRRFEAYGPLDFDMGQAAQLQTASPSEASLADLSDRDRAIRKALRAANPFAALGLSLAEAMAAKPSTGKNAVEAFEALLGPRRGDQQAEAARSRVKAAGEAVDKMLTQDTFGAQQLAELLYVLDEEDGIITQQRAAALLKIPPGCGEAVANGAVSVRYQAVLGGIAATCPSDATRGWDILREAIDAAARPATSIWTPPAGARGVEVSAAMGLRDLKRPRRLVGLEFAGEVFRIEPGNTLCLLMMTDGAQSVQPSQMAEAVAANQGRPKAVATQLAAVASEALKGDGKSETPSVGVLAAQFSVKAWEDPSQQPEPEDPKKRKAPEVVVGPQPGGGMPNRIRVSHILLKWESLTAHDSNARRAPPKGRTQADAEKELLKLLQVLSSMPHGTPTENKKLASKFAELSKAHSDCNSANNGALADLGWIVPGQSDKDFEAAAFDLAVGAISDIVISQRGAHLIHRLA
ncbi:unnamed protein product [Effrenium voratum]|nr:unnamed protein product [Effrenium voratum]